MKYREIEISRITQGKHVGYVFMLNRNEYGLVGEPYELDIIMESCKRTIDNILDNE